MYHMHYIYGILYDTCKLYVCCVVVVLVVVKTVVALSSTSKTQHKSFYKLKEIIKIDDNLLQRILIHSS